MCDTPVSESRAFRPRWGALYTIAVAALGGLALASAATSPVTRVTLGAVTGVATITALAWWHSANRVALDLADWCECASGTVTIRVIGAAHSSASHRPGYLRMKPVGATSRSAAYPTVGDSYQYVSSERRS